MNMTRMVMIGAIFGSKSVRNHPHESWPHSGVSRQRELAWVRRILILYVGDYEPTLKGPLPVGVVMHRTNDSNHDHARPPLLETDGPRTRGQVRRCVHVTDLRDLHQATRGFFALHARQPPPTSIAQSLWRQP